MNFEYHVTVDGETLIFQSFEFALADFLGRGIGRVDARLEKVPVTF